MVGASIICYLFLSRVLILAAVFQDQSSIFSAGR